MGRPWCPDAMRVQQRTPPVGKFLAEPLLDAEDRHQRTDVDGGETLLSTKKLLLPLHESTAAPDESAASFARFARRGWSHYRAAEAAAAAAGSGRQRGEFLAHSCMRKTSAHTYLQK